MERENDAVLDDLLSDSPRLFERLKLIPGYVWDETLEPFHSSYDNWHVFGRRLLREHRQSSLGSFSSSRPESASGSSASGEGTVIDGTHNPSSGRPTSTRDDSDGTSSSDKGQTIGVVARISTHVLQVEREHRLILSLLDTVDPEGKHVVRPLELVELPGVPGEQKIIVSVVLSPGPSVLKEMVNFGPAWYHRSKIPANIASQTGINYSSHSPEEDISLSIFLEFAIGAAECLELLHHGQRMVHGELRGDAFHFNLETGLVKFVNFGGGSRSYEYGLSSTGWMSLSKEVGIKNKLQFIAPEQTGRLPAAPDTRTDIYSLGILFWTMLTREPVFDGASAMDVVQSVLGKRIPPVATKRMDIPDAISAIIQKMTMKQIDERYYSISGVKHDLVEIQKILDNGDGEALKNFQIASKDVSSLFVLPTGMVGRKHEHDKIVRIIQKVSRRHAVEGRIRAGIHTLGSSSSVSDQADSRDIEGSSESNSADIDLSRSNSLAGPQANGSSSSVQTDSNDGHGLVPKQSSDSLSLRQPGSPQLSQYAGHALQHSHSRPSNEARLPHGRGTSGDIAHSVAASASKLRASPRSRRKGRCEVISVAGSAGLGKSRLVQSIRTEARRYGYFASAKFDQARKEPFEPVLKLMASLFRQIFSEGDVSTDFHAHVRAYVRPIWSLLHVMLDIPEHLLGPSSGVSKPGASSATLPPAAPQFNKSLLSEMPRRNSPPSNTPTLTLGPGGTPPLITGPSPLKSLRFMSTFLDILRLFTQHKFICLCLDDLQFADEESLDLIAHMVAAKIKLVLIVTFRPEEITAERVWSVLDSGNANLTKIELRALSEDEITEYVANALHRPQHYILPLAAVLEERTQGNPFFLREMLDQCHRKACFWFDWKESGWVYDLDRVFTEFKSQECGQILNEEFVLRRLNDLSETARNILAWASLLGSSFSFTLVERLLSGEFDYNEKNEKRVKCSFAAKFSFLSRANDDAINGLQACLQARVLIPGNGDDQFRFAHDRYMQAAMSLCNDVTKMHFLIAQTLMRYRCLDNRDLYTRASHVCRSVNLIKKRVVQRGSYRSLLFEAGLKASESGAATAAVYYLRHCKELLQDNPWRDGPDADYQETLSIYNNLTERLWNTAEFHDALGTLQVTLDNARTTVEKCSSWVLQSRILAQLGKTIPAFHVLKHGLQQLGSDIKEDITWEECDTKYHEVIREVERLGQSELIAIPQPAQDKETFFAVAALVNELCSLSFWTCAMTFYQGALEMVSMHLKGGDYPMVGLAYLYLAFISAGRFGRIQLGLELGHLSGYLVERLENSFAINRRHAIVWLLLGHLEHHLRVAIPVLETALQENIAGTGDRLLVVLNVGSLVVTKFMSSIDLQEVESSCDRGPEELKDYYTFRGGTYVVAVRQVARALQGKTKIHSPEEIFDDENHNTQAYRRKFERYVCHPNRSLETYTILSLIPLYLYGHYDACLEASNGVIESIQDTWTMRVNRLAYFYTALTLLAILRRDPNSKKRAETLERVREYKGYIDEWCVHDDVNYGMWTKLLTAELCDATSDFGGAITWYEAAADHAQRHEFTLEAGMTLELTGEFYLRRGATRAARSFIADAARTYTSFSATGLARHVADKYAWLVRDHATARTAEIGCQTEGSGQISRLQRVEVDENDRNITFEGGNETTHERTENWLTPGIADNERNERNEVSGLGIDVIDLQSILTSSQVMSSELQVNLLVPKMCELILEGNSADFAAIIIEEEDVGWTVAATGNNDHEVKAFNPGLPLSEAEVEEGFSKQIVLYCLRTRETVFLQNIYSDERFNNVEEDYMANNPLGKSVIALPILHGGKDLLGALYLEAAPNSFTDHNLTVLRLLVNQMAISIANAKLFNKVRKVSATNVSMIESQKRALEKARAAEAKAKLAEAQAMLSVRQKEEAAKAKSIFLANVSHELRTPLNGVIGMSELLKGTVMSKEQGEYADSIRVCADTLLTLINDVLDLTKLDAGKMLLVKVPFNLSEAIQEVVRALACTNQDVNLKTIQKLKLPSVVVLGDPVRLHQILMNLLSNSYKFTPRGTVTVEASVERESKDDIRILCSVTDTGIGIKDEQLKHLFVPFTQADSSTARKYGGSGLGLSICKSLITLMHGRVWIKSTEGVGTTVAFTLTLPKAPMDALTSPMQVSVKEADPMDNIPGATPSAPPVKSPTFVDLSAIPRHQLRICIAEDNPVNQKIAISFVKKLGFQVDAYNNGQEAVDALRSKAQEGSPYHLVLMDVQMPILDGYDATRAIRRDPVPAVREVLIVAMTASAIQGDREKCIDAGMNNYLAKPVRAAVLKSMLEHYLQQPNKPIPNLQQTANDVAQSVMRTVQENGVEGGPDAEDGHISSVASPPVVGNGLQNGSAPSLTSSVSLPSAMPSPSPPLPPPNGLPKENGDLRRMSLHEMQKSF